MKEEKDLLNEITKNFSELFVETFLIRYLHEYDKDNLLEDIEKVNQLLNKEIIKKFRSSLKSMGYDPKTIKKYLNEKRG